MSKPFELQDIGSLLDGLERAADATSVQEIARSPFSATTLISLTSNTEYSLPETPHEERVILVLEGHATVTVDKTRQTLGSGHLLFAEPGATITVWNESSERWSAISVVTPPVPST